MSYPYAYDAYYAYHPNGQPQYQYQQSTQHHQHPQGHHQSHSQHHGHHHGQQPLPQSHHHAPPHSHHQPHAHHHGHQHQHQHSHSSSSRRPVQQMTYRQMLNEIEQKYRCQIEKEEYIQQREGRDVHSTFYYLLEHGGRKKCIGSSSLENTKGEARENAAHQAVGYLIQAGYKWPI